MNKTVNEPPLDKDHGVPQERVEIEIGVPLKDALCQESIAAVFGVSLATRLQCLTMRKAREDVGKTIAGSKEKAKTVA